MWTLNNYTDEEVDAVRESVLREDVAYVCFGKEVGESGTNHLQGYMEFTKKFRLGGVKRIRGFGRVHLEVRRGTREQAVEYTKKEGNWEEHGEVVQSNQGRRNDLLKIKDAIDAGASERDIADEYFGQWVRYRKSFQAYRQLRSNGGLREVEVYCIWGYPGTGKTRLVYSMEPSLFIQSDPSLTWFDGYAGEEAVLLDDYRGDGNEAFVLRLLDRYPLRVPVKGGFVNWQPLRIYITSNMEPPFGHESIRLPLMRRIKNTVRLSNNLDFSDELGIGLFFQSIIQ